MNRFLDLVLFDNTIREYALVAGSILLAFFLKRLISRYVAGLLFQVVMIVARGIDKRTFVELVIRPLEIFLVLFITLVSIDRLSFPHILNFKIYKISFHEVVDGLSMIVLVIAFIWLLLRIIDFIAVMIHERANLTNDPADNQLVIFFKDFFKFMLIILGLLMILKFAFNYPVGNLVTGLSIATAAIALATRESLENLIASFIIFFDKPFTAGDLVKVQGITGTVEKIGLRSTRIRTDQKTYVTVPNKQMVDSIMDNLTLRTQRRAYVQLELAATTTPQQLGEFTSGVDQILKQRRDRIENYSVFLSDIARSAFVVQVEYFTAPIPLADFNALRQDVNMKIAALMNSLQVSLATKDGSN